MKIRFVYPKFARHAEAHPELRQHVPCNEYFGPPSLGIACLAAVTPPHWEFDFRDDRLEDVGLDDDVDIVAISFFTPSAKRAMELGDAFRARGRTVVMGGIFPTMRPDEAALHADAVVVGEAEGVWPQLLEDYEKGELKPRYAETTMVDLSTLPLPRVDLYIAKEGGAFTPDDYPVQT
ncbi:MAG TPA: cobalamin-dependent protein, partial [Polyangiaceae bacterium]|nr:cobalamin-dependent protein [Polyangiaceae bacterium]